MKTTGSVNSAAATLGRGISSSEVENKEQFLRVMNKHRRDASHDSFIEHNLHPDQKDVEQGANTQELSALDATEKMRRSEVNVSAHSYQVSGVREEKLDEQVTAAMATRAVFNGFTQLQFQIYHDALSNYHETLSSHQEIFSKEGMKVAAILGTTSGKASIDPSAQSSPSIVKEGPAFGVCRNELFVNDDAGVANRADGTLIETGLSSDVGQAGQPHQVGLFEQVEQKLKNESEQPPLTGQVEQQEVASYSNSYVDTVESPRVAGVFNERVDLGDRHSNSVPNAEHVTSAVVHQTGISGRYDIPDLAATSVEMPTQFPGSVLPGSVLNDELRNGQECHDSTSSGAGHSAPIETSHLSGIADVTEAKIDPSAKEREPSAIAREPSAIAREPSAIAREPSAIEREPSAIEREPSVIAREPSAIAREPSTIEKEPSTLVVKPSALVAEESMPSIILGENLSTPASEIENAAANMRPVDMPSSEDRPSETQIEPANNPLNRQGASQESNSVDAVNEVDINNIDESGFMAAQTVAAPVDVAPVIDTSSPVSVVSPEEFNLMLDMLLDEKQAVEKSWTFSLMDGSLPISEISLMRRSGERWSISMQPKQGSEKSLDDYAEELKVKLEKKGCIVEEVEFA
jgi:hypothetical protein